MANLDIDPTQAEALLQSGAITQDQYSQMAGPPVAPVVPEPDPTLTAQPLPPPVTDPDAERKARQRELFDVHTAGVEDMLAESERRKIEEKRAEIAEKRDIAQKMGLSPEEIDRSLGPQEAELANAESQLTSYQPPMAETAPPQSEDIQLASDGQTLDVAPVAQDPLGGLGKGYDLQTAGIMEAAQIGREKAAAEGAHLKETLAQQEDLARKQELERAKEQARLEEASQGLEADIKELNNTKVDRNRVFANMGTGDKILAAIGLFLGAYGAPSNKGRNSAADAMEKIIDQDIKAQMADIDTKKAGVSAKQNSYKMMRARFGDNETARKAAKVAGLQHAELRLEEIATRFKGKESGARALEAIGQIQVKKDALTMEIMKEYAARQALSEGNLANMDEDTRKRYVPGFGLALTPEDAKAIKEKVGVINNAKRGIKDLLAISGRPLKSISPNDIAEAKTTAQMLIGNLRLEIVGPGALSEKEVDLLNNIIADPTKLASLDSSNRTRLETLMKRLDSSLKEDAKARGLVSPEDQMGITPRN